MTIAGDRLFFCGMLGKITRLEDNYVVLQVADNVELKFQRSYIQAILPKGTLKSLQDKS